MSGFLPGPGRPPLRAHPVRHLGKTADGPLLQVPPAPDGALAHPGRGACAPDTTPAVTPGGDGGNGNDDAGRDGGADRGGGPAARPRPGAPHPAARADEPRDPRPCPPVIRLGRPRAPTGGPRRGCGTIAP